jgi:secondary thiamine-phosphate synthase enzyme
MSQPLRAVPFPGYGVRTAQVEVATSAALEFVDLTPRLRALAAEWGLVEGLLSVQTLHTTTGLVVNEAEPLLLGDLADLFERLAPRFETYAHDDLERRASVQPGERRNGHAHCRAALLPTSVMLHVRGRALVLGRWQRVLLAELDGPQRRLFSVLAIGDLDGER